MSVLGPTDHNGPTAAEPHDQTDFEQQETEAVANAISQAMPWAVSFLLHAGLVLLTLFIVWSTLRHSESDEVIIPIARLSQKPDAPLSMQTAQRIQSTSSLSRRSVSPVQSPSKMNFNTKVDMTTRLVGVAGSSAAKNSPFALSIRPRDAFKVSFYGTGGNARRLAYLVDASGSLIDSFPFVIQELKRSIGELGEEQSFTVIFFQNNDAIEVPPRGLRKATAQTKARVLQWIDPATRNITPIGQSSPIKAVHQALRYRPQLLFILSDNITGAGRFEINQTVLLKQISSANVANTKISTIQFLHADPLTRVGLKGTLELIAGRTGGTYKFLDARELGL